VNMPAPNDPELDGLLGAYALDALDTDERIRVEVYLAGNAQAARVNRLVGMVERAAAIGARIDIGRGAHPGGTEVRLELPLTGSRP